MSEGKNENLINFLVELAKDDSLFKLYKKVRANKELRELEEKMGRFNLDPEHVRILTQGSDEDVFSLVQKLNEDGKVGIWIIITLLEPVGPLNDSKLPPK